MKETTAVTSSDNNSETKIEPNLEVKADHRKTMAENQPSANKPLTAEQKVLKYALFVLFAGITIYLVLMVMNLWVMP